MKKDNLKYFFLGIIILLFFYDLGNIDGLRQGTEGFYLLISQEMYEAGDLLTPRIYGDYHWSKPPLQFWLPMGFYKLFGGSYLYWARFSVLCFSLFCLFLISLWYEDELKRNWHEAFCGLLVPFYFIKYSRIFMMESALTLLTTLGALYLLSYLNRGRNKHLLWGGIFTGLSVLVKGPVSLVMIAPPLFAYTFLAKKNFTRFFKFMIFGFIVGSLWFIASTIRFGSDFFNYFFIRENLGKFTSKTYPARHVLQGLLIYSFPIWLLLPAFWKDIKKVILSKKINWFFVISFCCFFFLWFLPKQRSHHYAVPSIPIFCLFILYNFYESKKKAAHYFKKLSILFHSFFALCAILLFALYKFKEDLSFQANDEYFMGALFIFGLWTYLNQNQKATFGFLRFALLFQLMWLFLIPLGILPTVPQKAVTIMSSTGANVFVNYRKPFFIMESLDREVTLLPSGNLSEDSIDSGDIVFINEDKYLESPEKENFQQLHRWKVWKRGSDTRAILSALQKGSLKSLQEHYTIVQKN